MHWKRSACGLLLTGGLAVFNVGCAAVDAIVNSPAGHSAQQASPARIAAIGRVFENQGQYARAQVMYRRVLKSDPNNVDARDGLNTIAARGTNGGSNRSFNSSSGIQTGVAIADSLNGNQRTKPRRLGSRSPRPVHSPMDVIQQDRDAVVASLQTAGPAIQTEPVKLVPAQVALTDLDWSLDEGEPNDAADVALTFAPSATELEPSIATIAFDGDDQGVATIASMDSGWRATQRLVSLDDLIEWSDSPAEYTENLLLAVSAGENDGVKAYAATLLAECPFENSEIDDVLAAACEGGSSMLRVSARDSLIQRGHLDEDGVNDLLELMSDSNPDIRAQAAASMRNCVGSEWAPQCVAGLDEMLNDPDPSIVAVAAATLGDFGSEAIGCRGALMNLLSTSDNDLTMAAADLALNRIPVPDVTLSPVDSASEEELPSATSADGYLPVVE